MIRKAGGFGAYAEGWALYSEQLAQEMGFYRRRAAERAGLHPRRPAALRPPGHRHRPASPELEPREGDRRAVAASTATRSRSPTQEIERYCVWPGQACSYMVGKLTILRLREKAKTALGAEVRHPPVPRRRAAVRLHAADRAGERRRQLHRLQETNLVVIPGGSMQVQQRTVRPPSPSSARSYESESSPSAGRR